MEEGEEGKEGCRNQQSVFLKDAETERGHTDLGKYEDSLFLNLKAAIKVVQESELEDGCNTADGRSVVQYVFAENQKLGTDI